MTLPYGEIHFIFGREEKSGSNVIPFFINIFFKTNIGGCQLLCSGADVVDSVRGAFLKNLVNLITLCLLSITKSTEGFLFYKLFINYYKQW